MFYWVAFLKCAIHEKRKRVIFFCFSSWNCNTNRKVYIHLQPHRAICQKFVCSFSLESSPKKGESAYLTYGPDSHSCWQNSAMLNEWAVLPRNKGWEPGTGQFSGLLQCCIILKKPYSRTGIRDCAWELPSAKTTMKIYRLGENILTY